MTSFPRREFPKAETWDSTRFTNNVSYLPTLKSRQSCYIHHLDGNRPLQSYRVVLHEYGASSSPTSTRRTRGPRSLAHPHANSSATVLLLCGLDGLDHLHDIRRRPTSEREALPRLARAPRRRYDGLDSWTVLVAWESHNVCSPWSL